MAAARAIMRHPRVEVTDLEARLGTRYTAVTLAALQAALSGGALRLAHGGGQPGELPPLGALDGDHGAGAGGGAGAAGRPAPRRAVAGGAAVRALAAAAAAGTCAAVPRAAGLDAGERADARSLVERSPRAGGVASMEPGASGGRAAAASGGGRGVAGGAGGAAAAVAEPLEAILAASGLRGRSGFALIDLDSGAFIEAHREGSRGRRRRSPRS